MEIKFELKKEWKPLLGIIALFPAAYYLSTGLPRFDGVVDEAQNPLNSSIGIELII
jgi:hypothetical protein